MLENLGRPARIVLLGGTSEIGLAILTALKAPAASQVLLAGRDEARLAAAGKELPFQVTTMAFDALELDTHKAIIDQIFAAGPVDLVIAATGILTPQDDVDRDPVLGGRMIDINFTSHVTTLVEAAALEGNATQVWVPRSLSVLATALRLVPRPIWRKMRR